MIRKTSWLRIVTPADPKKGITFSTRMDDSIKDILETPTAFTIIYSSTSLTLNKAHLLSWQVSLNTTHQCDAGFEDT